MRPALGRPLAGEKAQRPFFAATHRRVLARGWRKAGIRRRGGCGNHNRIRKTAHADRLVSYQFSASCCDIITQFGSSVSMQTSPLSLVVILFAILLQVGCFSTFLIIHAIDDRSSLGGGDEFSDAIASQRVCKSLLASEMQSAIAKIAFCCLVIATQ